MAPTPNLEVSVSIMNSLEKFSMTRIRTIIITFFKALSFLIPHKCIFFKQTIEWLYYLTITLHKPSVVASQTQKTPQLSQILRHQPIFHSLDFFWVYLDLFQVYLDPSIQDNVSYIFNYVLCEGAFLLIYHQMMSFYQL